MNSKFTQGFLSKNKICLFINLILKKIRINIYYTASNKILILNYFKKRIRFLHFKKGQINKIKKYFNKKYSGYLEFVLSKIK